MGYPLRGLEPVMKVYDLIEILQSYPPDLGVLFTWEGIDIGIDGGDFEQTIHNLVIDVDQY